MYEFNIKVENNSSWVIWLVSEMWQKYHVSQFCQVVVLSLLLFYISFSIQVVWQPIVFRRCNAVMHIGKLQLSDSQSVLNAAAAFRRNDLTSRLSVTLKKDLKPGCEAKSLETDILRGMRLLEEALPQSS